VFRASVAPTADPHIAAFILRSAVGVPRFAASSALVVGPGV